MGAYRLRWHSQVRRDHMEENASVRKVPGPSAIA